MIDSTELFKRVQEKAEEIKFSDPGSDVGVAFNNGINTLLNYVYIISSQMYWENREKEGANV